MSSVKAVKNCEPLEERLIAITDSGICRKVKALSTHFTTQRKLVYFCAPPRPDKSGRFVIGSKAGWIQRANSLKEDLQWLLSLPHHKFWSQVVFHKETWGVVTSFLQEAYPFYCLDRLPDDYSIQEAYYTIHSLVFCVLTRVTSHHESETEWIREKKLGELLYDNYLISLPLLYDICVIYGSDNEDLVRKLFDTVFSIQPLYKDDVENSVQYLKCALNSIRERFLKVRQESGDPIKLEEKARETAKSYALGDIIYYLLDISVCIRTFLQFYKEGPCIYHKHKLEYCISVMYETAIPELATLVKSSTDYDSGMDMYFEYTLKLNQARYYLIEIFRMCLKQLLEKVDSNKSPLSEAEAKETVYSFIDTLVECSSEKSFMEDYLKKYPMSQDLEKIIQACPDLDPFKYTFLSDMVVEYKAPSYNNAHESNLEGAAYIPPEPVASTSKDFNIQGPNEVAAFRKEPQNPQELSVLISEVKEILPHLGDGFIKACLEHDSFSYSSSSVINSLLEGTLPQSLACLDQEMPYIPPEEGPTGDLYHRVNVFDNDEFDVMTRDKIDKTRVHRGKRKDKYKDLTQMIDDKSFREDLRDKFSKLGIVEDDEADYNDEYDDTYDDVDVTVDDAGDSEELKPILEPLNEKRGRRKLWEVEEVDGDEEENGDEKPRRGGFVPFAENPEDIRARYAARRASMHHRGGGRGRGPPADQQQKQNRDVVGNARGQGQSNEVLRNRQKKEANKSSRANHNRKNASSFKRRGGLLPT